MSGWMVGVVGPPVCLALVRAARRADTGGRARLIRQRARWRVPPRARARLERALADADLELTPEAALELAAIGIAALGMGTAVVAPGLLVPVLLAGAVGAPVALHVARARRERRFVAAVPGALEQVAAELRGGGSVASAIERLGDSDSAPPARSTGSPRRCATDSTRPPRPVRSPPRRVSPQWSSVPRRSATSSSRASSTPGRSAR